MKYLEFFMQTLQSAITASIFAVAGGLMWAAYTGHLVVMSGMGQVMIMIKMPH